MEINGGYFWVIFRECFPCFLKLFEKMMNPRILLLGKKQKRCSESKQTELHNPLV